MSRTSGRDFEFLITLSFILLSVGLLTFMAVSGYRQALASQQNDDAIRGTLTYLQTQIKAHDQVDGIELADDGQRLILREEQQGEVYENRIYVSNGQLVESYVMAGQPDDPANMTVIAATSMLQVTALTPRLLAVSTDAGTVRISLMAAEVRS